MQIPKKESLDLPVISLPSIKLCCFSYSVITPGPPRSITGQIVGEDSNHTGFYTSPVCCQTRILISLDSPDADAKSETFFHSLARLFISRYHGVVVTSTMHKGIVIITFASGFSQPGAWDMYLIAFASDYFIKPVPWTSKTG